MSVNSFKDQARHLRSSSVFDVDKMEDQPLTLSPLFAKSILKFAACSSASFNNDEDWVKPFNYHFVKPFQNKIFLPVGNVRSHDYCFFSEETGLKVSVFENSREVIVAFGAFNSGHTELPEERREPVAKKQIETIKANLMGETPCLYETAKKVVTLLLRHPKFDGKKFSVCGQSFGGSIAEYVGLSLRIDAYCFNSIMLGAGLSKQIPEKNKREACEFIRIISVENDFASDLIDARPHSFLTSMLGLPCHFGCRFVLPSAYSSMVERHIYMMGSLMHHLGYDVRTRTSALPSHAILSETLSYEALSNKLTKVKKANLLLARFLKSSKNEKLRKVLKKIQKLNPEAYAFLCFAVWRSLGKRDCGDPQWGEKRLLEDPKILGAILNSRGFSFIYDLTKFYEFIIFVFELIPKEIFISKLPTFAVEQLTNNVRTKMGLSDFKIDKKDLGLFISKLYVFLSDQLENGLKKIAEASIADAKKDYQILPKEHLLATRFNAASSAAKRILIASVEYLGVLKVGGLAEAVREMASGLREQGHQVTLILPKYEKFPQDATKAVFQSIQKTEMVAEHFFDGKRKDALFRGKVGNVDTLFLEQEKLKNDEKDLFELGTRGIYKIAGDDAHATQLKERFAYFGSALAAFIYQMRDHFDVVIFNDWHGALAIHLAVSRYFNAWRNAEIPALVYVFHNNGYAAQGILDGHSKPLFQKLGVNADYLNVTEQSLRFADHCCTVSPSYAVEVQGREGNGLTEQMRKVAAQGKLTGILNGANPQAFNPETDPVLMNWKDPETGLAHPLNYGAESNILEKKQEIKLQLQKWLRVYHPEFIEEFSVDVTRKNVLLFVGRFDSSQKGLEKFRLAMHAAKNQGATLIIMGSYSTDDDVLARKIIADLRHEAAALKGKDWGGVLILEDKVNALNKYDFQQGTIDGIPGIGSLCRAIATYGFFPSKYEPCGLVQFEMWLFAFW